MYMKNILMLFFAITVLTASQESAIQEKEMVVSPSRCLAPERGYIASEFFAFVCIRPDFATPMAPAYGDLNTMKYMGNGSTARIEEVREWFSWRAQRLNSEQNPQVYSWGVITRDGVCGVASAFLRNLVYLR